jgi:hypothetical protein
VGRSMAKARPLRKTGRKSGGKSAKEARSSAEVKRTAATLPPKPADRLASRKPVPARPSRKELPSRKTRPSRKELPSGKAPGGPERLVVAPEIPPPLPAPIASFTF